MDILTNFFEGALNATIGAGDTTMAITLPSGITAPAAPYNLTIWNFTDCPNPSDDVSREIVRVTAASQVGQVLTIEALRYCRCDGPPDVLVRRRLDR